MGHLRSEGSKSTFCPPHTADQVFCPTEGGGKDQTVSTFKYAAVTAADEDIFNMMEFRRFSPHSEPGYWEEPRRWGKTPPQIPRCCQPGISLEKERGCLEKRGFSSHAIWLLRLKELTKRVNVQFVNKIPQPFNHILYLLHALPLFKKVSHNQSSQLKTSIGCLLSEIRRQRGDSRPRRRSPRCRVCLCGAAENCHCWGWRERRCRLFPCSTLYRSAPTLQRGTSFVLNLWGKKKDDAKHHTFLPLQAQERRFCVASQKGWHSPLWQRPLSTQVVLSSALEGGGQWLLLPNVDEEQTSVN